MARPTTVRSVEAPLPQPLEASSTSPPHRWVTKSGRPPSTPDRNTWSRMYTPHTPTILLGSFCPMSSLLTSAFFIPDKPLRLHLGSKTLLQRLHPLRPPQTPPRPLPLAAQTLVPRATPLPFHPGRRIQLLFPASPGRHQFTRHVHPRHGLCHLHPALHPPGRSTGCIPPGSHGVNRNDGLRGGLAGDTGVEVWDLHIEHQQRQPVARPGGVLGLQIRRGDRHTGHIRDFESGTGHGGMGRLDRVRVYIHGQRFLLGMAPSL